MSWIDCALFGPARTVLGMRAIEIVVLIFWLSGRVTSDIPICVLNNIDHCFLTCSGGNYSLVGSMLDSTVAKQGLCRYREYSVELAASIRFHNDSIIPHGWLNATLRLILLQIDMQHIEYIEPDAFGGTAFSSVRTLMLIHFRCSRLDPHQFRGLAQLRMLMIINLKTGLFIDSYLQDVAPTLQELIVTSSDRPSMSAYVVDGLTGPGPHQLTSANSVRFMLPLGSMITNRTFAGLVSVAYLDLSNCHITTIAAGAFLAAERTLLQLKLVNNQLVRIPAGLFDVVALRTNVEVRLSQNPWACDCGEPNVLGEYLAQYPTQFSDEAVCATPKWLRGTRVNQVPEECQPESGGNPGNGGGGVPEPIGERWIRCNRGAGGPFDYVPLQPMSRRNWTVWWSYDGQQMEYDAAPFVQLLCTAGAANLTAFQSNATVLVCLQDCNREPVSISPFECVAMRWPANLANRPVWLGLVEKEPVVMGLAGFMVLMWFVGLGVGVVARSVWPSTDQRAMGRPRSEKISVSSESTAVLSIGSSITMCTADDGEDYEYSDCGRYAASYAASYAAYRYLVILSDYCQLDRLPECHAPAVPSAIRRNSLQ